MANGKTPPLTPEIYGGQRKERIGDQLRKLYQDVATEPVPEEFMRLLETADANLDDAETKDIL